MSTPRFVVKRVGDEYVTVPEEVYPRLSGYVCGGWAGLLLLLAVRSSGLLRRALLLAGVAVAVRAFKGEGWWLSLFRRRDDRLMRRPWGRTPSYHHDSPRIGQQVAEDVVEEASMESFPASDPPGWTRAASPK